MDVLYGVTPRGADGAREARASDETASLSYRMTREMQTQQTPCSEGSDRAGSADEKRAEDDARTAQDGADRAVDPDAGPPIGADGFQLGALHARRHGAPVAQRERHGRGAASAVSREGSRFGGQVEAFAASNEVAHTGIDGTPAKQSASGTDADQDTDVGPLAPSGGGADGSSDAIGTITAGSPLNVLASPPSALMQADGPAPSGNADARARDTWLFNTMPPRVENAASTYTHVFHSWYGKPFARVRFDLGRSRNTVSVMTDDPDVFDALSRARDGLEGGLCVVQAPSRDAIPTGSVGS